MFRRVYNPFRLMHEPPAITMGMMLIYGCFALAGISVIFIPSDMVLTLFGAQMAKLIGIATLMGGTAGVIAVWPGWWWLERAGLAGCSIAIFAYMASLYHTEGWDGGVIFREFMIIIILLFLTIRLLWISSLDLDPTKPPFQE